MRFVVFYTLFLFASTLAAEPISGKVTREESNVFITDIHKQECKKFLVVKGNKEAEKSLVKLSTGDYLTGSGTIDSKKCQVVMEVIDYVGLRRLLGYWYSDEGIVSVKDFTSLSFYSVHSRTSRPLGDQVFRAGAPTEYRYSLMPTEGSEWIIFLSDSSSTTFATIQFIGTSILMKVFHAETGDVTKVLHLSKWGNPLK